VNAEGTGVGLSFGAGWDIPLSRHFALTLNGSMFVTAIGDIILPGRTVDDVITSTYALSVGLVLR
jgi:hypothetical protein